MYQAIVFLPLIGFLIAGLFGSSIGAKASEYITSGLLVICAVLSWIAFFTVGFGDGDVFTIPVMRCIDVGSLQADWALQDRHADRGHAGGRHHRVVAGPHLLDRLHARTTRTGRASSPICRCSPSPC